MNCDILETLYIRSNGDIPCHDDAGETILLGRVEQGNPDWDILTVFDNPFYQHIWTALREGAPPWPETRAQECAPRLAAEDQRIESSAMESFPKIALIRSFPASPLRSGSDSDMNRR